MGLAGVRTALRKGQPAVFLCYDVHVDTDVEHHTNEEISSTAWFTLGQCAALDWVSETMHQLAVDGLTRRSLMRNQAGLTPRTNPYAVYRTSKTENVQARWLVVIPSSRLKIHGVPNDAGEVVVYWMTAARRAQWNHALQHAVDLAKQHNVPLVVIECLALQHRWANDRISTFVLQGMVDNRAPSMGPP